MSSSKSLLAVGVSILLVNPEGKILLGDTHASGMLSTPGGRIEENETRFDCAVREFREECGAELDPMYLTDVGFREHFRYDMHYFMCYIKATNWEGEITNPEPDKHKDWAWYDPTQIVADNCTEPRDILYKLSPIGNEKDIADIRRKLIASDIFILDRIHRHIHTLEQLNERRLEELYGYKQRTTTERCIK